MAGMLLFVLFYIIAVLQYTGGSYASLNQVGFSFKNNYLCDLLNDHAINETLNSSQTSARISLAILCFSMMVFWYYLPKLFNAKSKRQTVMSITGIVSMGVLLFLVSGTHDVIIRVSGIFGSIAFFISLVELYETSYYRPFVMGSFSLTLFLANYFMYETKLLVDMLPIIQKITFIACLSCFILLDIALYKKLKNS